MRSQLQPVATFIEYREICDRPANIQELISLISDLDAADSAKLLCQMNADFRLTKRDKEAMGKMQQDIAGGLLSDETIGRLKERFGKAHMADRPIFHPAQMLNILRLLVENSKGTRSPLNEASARYALGDACLMMSDLMMTDHERTAVKSGDRDSISRALMVQMLGPFEVQNPSAIQHVAYRSRIMFRELLQKEAVLARIRQYQGFNFESEFSRITSVALRHWLSLMLAFHAYLMHYRDKDGVTRHPEFLAIDRLEFRRDTPILQEDMDAVLRTVSTTLDDFRYMLQTNGAGDWRFDSIPFRNKPLVELQPGKFYCFDMGLLVEKIHSGVYWTIHDGLSQAERFGLSGAWGILFEEYVNWFLGERQFKDFLFWRFPKWSDGGECFDGAFMRNGVLMPMEYKGGFLLRGARYSGDQALFERELESKIVKGCKQLARNIEALFNRRTGYRKALESVPSDHVTRVVPLLVVQDHILGGPLVNWQLNERFNKLLDRATLRPGVTVDALNVVGIRELETMAESAEAGTFDLFGGLQYRCYADPEMRSNLHNFLLDRPGYGEGKSTRIKAILDQQYSETIEYLFGKNRGSIQTDAA
jgi:hypothetical protein